MLRGRKGRGAKFWEARAIARVLAVVVVVPDVVVLHEAKNTVVVACTVMMRGLNMLGIGRMEEPSGMMICESTHRPRVIFSLVVDFVTGPLGPAA